MGKNRKGKNKKMSGKDEDSNVNADTISEDAREIVQSLQEIFTLHSEEEIYAMLLDCKMDTNEAINRLLSQGSFQEVKSKRCKKKEAKEKKAIMDRRNKESSVNEDYIPEDSREVVQKLKEFVNCSEQETYQMLVKCNMNSDEALNRLLSQGFFDSSQQVESKQDEKKETKDTSDCQGVSSSDQNHEFMNGCDSYVCLCGGNKFNSDETSSVQGICNHLDGSSITFGTLGLSSLNSDLTKIVPISSSEAVPSLSMSSSRLIYASGCGTSGQKKMADVVKMSEDKAPVKTDRPLPEKRDVPISFIESAPLNQLREFARIKQLQESASVYDQNFQDDDYGGSRSNNKNDETYQVQKAKDPLPSWRFATFGSAINGCGQPSGLLSTCLNDDSEDISDFPDDFRGLNIRDDECHEEEEPNAARNYHSFSNYDQTKPTQGNQNKSSSATDFTFDNSQLFNLVMASSEPSLQRRNFNTFPNAMHQQAYTRESDPQYLASPLQLSMPTISSPGRRLPLSITEALMASNSEPQMNGQAYTREPDPQYSAPPLHHPMASINEPHMNGQAINQQAYTPDPQYLASPLNHSMLAASSLGRRLSASKTGAMASISEPHINGQAMNQQAYTREPDPQYLAPPLHLSMASLKELQMNKKDPQYLAPPLHFSMDSINEIQMNLQATNQQAYIREPGPQYSASPLNQSMPTTSSLGGMASISKTQMNGQSMNHHYSQPTENDTYNMSPPAIQQHGGNNNTYLLQPLAALLPQSRNSDMSPSAVSFVPSPHSSANGLTYNSAYGFGMSSDNNGANSRFGSDNVFTSQLNNQLPSNQHQNGNSNVWTPQGHNDSGSNYYGSFTGHHHNQQSPSLRRSQQQQQEQVQRYCEFIHQQSNRRDPI